MTDRAQPDPQPDRLTPLHEMQLVDAHRAGDPTAMEELLKSYQRRVYGVCYRMLNDVDEARDLTQDAMVKVIEGLDTFDARARLSTWIIRVTMNCCLSYLRKKKVRAHGSLEHPAGDEGGTIGEILPATGELSAHDRVEQSELEQIALQALTELDRDARAILVLRDLQGLEYQQIGEVLDAPVGTVKSRLFRARAALREAVERVYDEGRTTDSDEMTID